MTVKQAASIMGRKGGAVTGPCKARSSEKMRAAIMVRWNKEKQLKKDNENTINK